MSQHTDDTGRTEREVLSDMLHMRYAAISAASADATADAILAAGFTRGRRDGEGWIKCPTCNHDVKMKGDGHERDH